MNMVLALYIACSAIAAGAVVGILVFRGIRRRMVARAAAVPAQPLTPAPRRSLRELFHGAYAELSRGRRSRQSKKILLLIGVMSLSLGGILTGKIIFALISALGAVAGVHVYFNRREQRIREQINAQLAEALGMIAGGVRAGQSLQQAFEFLAGQLKPPLSLEFTQVLSAVRLGMPLDEALQGLARRVPTPDMIMAVNAIHLAKETGGNLAEILTRVAATIAERRKIQGKVNALTAQGRASGTIMSIVPFILLGVLYVMEPAIVGLLFTTFLGNLMLLAVIVMIAAGAFIIGRIVNISI